MFLVYESTLVINWNLEHDKNVSDQHSLVSKTLLETKTKNSNIKRNPEL